MKTPSSALPSYNSSAAQRRAMPRGAMPFALGCDAVPCCGVFSFDIQSTRYHAKNVRYQVPAAGMYVYDRLQAFLLPSFGGPFSVMFFFANYTRIADQNAASPTSTHHSTEANQFCPNK